VIQRKILKAQAFVSRSVNRVFKANHSSKPLAKIFRPTQAEKLLPLLNSPLVLFAREALQNPRAFGAACPSSRQLAQAVAKLVHLEEEGLIVELGAGTGIMLEALLERGIPPHQIIGIERSSQLATYLKQHFPRCRIIEGDALHLQSILGEDCQRINTLICSLPFRILPDWVVHGIVKQVDYVLPKEGIYLQFTYDLSGKAPYLPHHFKRVSSKIVWGNLPPARINLYHVERSEN